MFEVARNTGRLVEARVISLASAEDVEAYLAKFTPELLGGSARPVLCADHRPVAIYSQAVSDMLARVFATMNPRWERVAILVAPSNATLALQLQRLVRESGNPSRRVFFEADRALAFLGEILGPGEIARLAAFLDGRGSGAPLVAADA